MQHSVKITQHVFPVLDNVFVIKHMLDKTAPLVEMLLIPEMELLPQVGQLLILISLMVLLLIFHKVQQHQQI